MAKSRRTGAKVDKVDTPENKPSKPKGGNVTETAENAVSVQDLHKEQSVLIVDNPKKNPEPDRLIIEATRHNVAMYKVYVDGYERWLPAGSIEVLIAQNKDPNKRDRKEITFPKGTPYVVPEHLRGGCNGCG